MTKGRRNMDREIEKYKQSKINTGTAKERERQLQWNIKKEKGKEGEI